MPAGEGVSFLPPPLNLNYAGSPKVRGNRVEYPSGSPTGKVCLLETSDFPSNLKHNGKIYGTHSGHGAVRQKAD